MLDTTFLLETAGNGLPTSLSAPFPEACAEANWLAGEVMYDCATVQLPESPMYGSGTTPDSDGPLYRASAAQQAKYKVPVGSIEFVNYFLTSQGMDPLQAMNIPPDLEQERFLGRRIFRDVSKEDLPKLEEEYGHLLVKPGRQPKLFEAVRSGEVSVIPNNEPLFVSQLLKETIVAEWRVFILRGRILDLRPYILTQWVCPDRDIVDAMAKILSGYAALALDVAVLAGGRTVAIESHPFIACGQYGFDGPDMIRMAKSAWLAELRRQGRG